jgi:hypothetical protein
VTTVGRERHVSEQIAVGESMTTSVFGSADLWDAVMVDGRPAVPFGPASATRIQQRHNESVMRRALIDAWMERWSVLCQNSVRRLSGPARTPPFKTPSKDIVTGALVDVNPR